MATADQKRTDDLIAILGDKKQRIRRLYHIQDITGQRILFTPNAAQAYIGSRLWWLNLILKSRQHGITTMNCIDGLDRCLWTPGYRAGIIAHTKEDATKFFRHKVLYAYDNMDPGIKEMIPITKRDMNGTLEFANGSGIDVSVSHRGGTFQFLHISEYGPMCAMFPQRAAEVKAGALNTVHEGAIVTIESTAMGRDGDYYDRCQRAQSLAQRIMAGSAQLTRMDYRFFFFGWHDDPKNVLDDPSVTFTKEDEDYFTAVEAELDKILSVPQRAWYVKKAEDQSDKMKQEHPSTPEEAFEVSGEAVYYAKELALARKQGRICRVPILPSVLLESFWDLGRNDMNALWVMQRVGLENRFVGYYENSGEDITHYGRWLKQFGEENNAQIGLCYLPHDAEVVELTRADGLSREQVLQGLGLKTVVVPRIQELGEGIDATRRQFPTYWFDAVGCKQGLIRLGQYRKRFNQQVQAYQDEPVKNDARNGADALRQHAQGYDDPSLRSRTPRKKKRANWKTR